MAHVRSLIRFALYSSLLLTWPLLRAQQNLPDTQHAVDLERQGKFEEAKSIWEQKVQLTPQDAQAWAHLGLTRSMTSHYAEATIAYRKALALGSTLGGLHLNLGLALFKQSQFRDAIPELRAAEIEAPNDQRPKMSLAMIYYGLLQYKNAIPYFEQVVSNTPDNLELRMLLANSCLRAKQFDCVLMQYEEVLQRQPESAEAYILAGEAYDGLGESAMAIEQFQKATKIAPHRQNVHFGLGYLFWEKSRLNEAKQEFELELNNDPNHVQALAYLGDIAIKNKDELVARTYLSKAISQPGATRIAFLDMGILDAGANRNDEAQADFEHAISMDPNQIDAHWRLARLYQAIGKPELAQREVLRVKQLHEHENQGLASQMIDP